MPVLQKMNLLYFWLRFSTDQMPLLGDSLGVINIEVLRESNIFASIWVFTAWQRSLAFWYYSHQCS